MKVKVILKCLYTQNWTHLYHFSMQNHHCPYLTIFWAKGKGGDTLDTEVSKIVSEILFLVTKSSSACFDDIGFSSNDNHFLQLMYYQTGHSVSIPSCIHKNSNFRD